MAHQQRNIPLFIISLIVLSAIIWCSPEQPKTGLPARLQSLVDNVIDAGGEDPVYNALLLVESTGFKWKGAAGAADGRQEIMTADHKIKIASIGKMFTATLILQLMEEGFLRLDDTIDRYLDNPAVDLDHLHMVDGTSYGRQITVRQLLNQTSGISDYMEDPRFIPSVMKNPHEQYSPEKIMARYYEYQTNQKAVFPPGQGFNYSDVNYVLLAMIVEKVTGKSYQNQLKQRIFDPLKMENSYLEYYENPRGEKPLSHAFFSMLDLVTDVNTSFDWGGGGIVSTCEELNVFIRALVGGRLFRNPATTRQMLGAADEGRGGTDYDYGLGIMKRTIQGLVFYGHGGAYDCDVFYCPTKNISIGMSLNQMNTHGKRDEFLMQAIQLLLS